LRHYHPLKITQRSQQQKLLTRIILLFGILTSVALARSEPAAADTRETTFGGYTPLASTSELLRRSLTPLDAAAAHAPPGQQTIDLRDERFIVRVPTQRPPNGFGVLVFIPPWNDGRSMEKWGSVLDRFGLIFVSPLRSGNDQSTLGRREPLAILAAYNVAKLYPVDPERVFVTGFSGGSRVAMRVALAYPDLFRGALLNAGSDAIGDRELPLPPRGLFDRFRRESSLAYATGALDEPSLDLDSGSAMSMRHWCVSNVNSRRIAGLGHDLIGGATLAATLSDLMRPADEARWAAACWSQTIREVDSKLDRAAAALASNDRQTARVLLTKIDHQYGGLAAPRILLLWAAANAAVSGRTP
jgi:pimeloyl-ACP methyl ester carboxylesterase